MNHTVPYCFGFSSGATLAAAWRWLTHPNTISGAAFLGSAVATAIGWLIARRAELQRAEIERQHELRQAARDERLADVLLELRIRQTRQKCIDKQ